MSNVLFLSLRVLHVLLAAVWLGSTAFMTFFVMPVIEQTGAAGHQVTIALDRRKLGAYFGAIGGTTVLTGIYLFWRFTGGFDPVVSGSPAGIHYSVGAAAGLLALILGGSVVGRSASKAASLLERAATLPDGADKRALMQQVIGLNGRMKTFGLIVLALQVVALVFMAVAHYV